MKLLITGATGLIGRRLVADRLARGDEVLALSRDAGRARRRLGDAAGLDLVEGDPTVPGDWTTRVDGCEAVINLAGAGLADRRWSASYKRELRRSRVEGTRQVVSALEAARSRPGVLLNASAVGYYGDTGEREVDESAPPGDDFLARLSAEWEGAAAAAGDLGLRVVLLRTGVVLDAHGGALPRLVTPFRLFAGGPIGAGRFHMSWIHREDVIGLIDVALRDVRAEGPLNVVAPAAVTNRAFCRALGRALRRPSWLPVPRAALRLALGEVARYVTASQRVMPTRALSLGYVYRHPEIGEALRALLRRSEQDGPGA